MKDIKYTTINNTMVPLCIICSQPVETDPMPYAKTTAKLLCKSHEHVAFGKRMGLPLKEQK